MILHYQQKLNFLLILRSQDLKKKNVHCGYVIIFKKFAINNMKKTGLKQSVFFVCLFVFNPIDTNNILDTNRSLVKGT